MVKCTLTGYLYASEYGQQHNLTWHDCVEIVAALKPAIMASEGRSELMALLEIQL